jgi:hypothetical protein
MYGVIDETFIEKFKLLIEEEKMYIISIAIHTTTY